MKKLKLLAGIPSLITEHGRFFRILSSAAEIEINFNSSIENAQWDLNTPLLSGIGLNFSGRPSPYTSFTMISDVDQTIEYFAGLDIVDDDRLSGNLDLNGSISVLTTLPANHSYLTIAMTGLEVELFPVRLGRRSMLVVPSGEITLDTGFVTSSAFEWNTSGVLKATGLNGVTVELFEDYE